MTVDDDRGNVTTPIHAQSHHTRRVWHSFRLILGTPINLKGHRSYNHTDYPCILNISNDNQYRNMRRLLLYLIVQFRRLSILLEYNHHYYLKGTKTSPCKEKYRQMHAKMRFLNSRHIHTNMAPRLTAKACVICGKNKRSSHLLRFHSFPKDDKR